MKRVTDTIVETSPTVIYLLSVCSECPCCEESDEEGDFYCQHPKKDVEQEKLDVFNIPDWCPIRKQGLLLKVRT